MLAQAADAIGSRTVAVVTYALDVAASIATGLVCLIRAHRQRRGIGGVLSRQIFFTGVEALPFTAFLAVLIALPLVVQARLQIAGLAESDLFGRVLVVVLVREIGPLLMALVVIGRSGTAMATEMANMRVAGEIRGLEWQGIDPFEYLVAPRLLGAGLSLAGLTIWFIGISLAAGFLLTQLLASANAPALESFIGAIARNLSPGDFLVVLAKTLVPGLLIAAIACTEGLRCGNAVTEVPRAATRGVVRTITAVFLWDALVSAVAYSA